ncbi:hypothetical protein [Streptomyces griseoruber]|nr:hypothetical protein [Streptomyces griseoruber]
MEDVTTTTGTTVPATAIEQLLFTVMGDNGLVTVIPFILAG